MKLPHSITRQLRQISFKTKESLLRHVTSLLAAYRYSQLNKQRDARHACERNQRQNKSCAARHARHARSCRQGYLAKINLVEAGKGCNTLAGIPA